MAFQFPFTTVLRIRQLCEEREEQILRRIFHEIAQVQQAITEVGHELLRLSELRAAETDSRMNGRDVGLRASAATALYECRSALQLQLEKLEELKDAQLAKYQAARQQREAVSELHEKGWLNYRAALTAREQRALDDNFNARRLRG